jgi:hypothetical protein
MTDEQVRQARALDGPYPTWARVRAAWNQIVWRMIEPTVRSVSPGEKNGW